MAARTPPGESKSAGAGGGQTETDTVTRIVTDPATDKLLLGQGLDAVSSSQEEFAELYAREINTWAKIVEPVGMKNK